MKLHTKIFIGLLAGFAVGSLLAILRAGEVATYIKPLGDIFIKLLKMIAIPLIAVSIMGATAGFADLKKLGRVGLKTVAFFLASMVLAASLGIVAANLFQPGKISMPPERRRSWRGCRPKAAGNNRPLPRQ